MHCELAWLLGLELHPFPDILCRTLVIPANHSCASCVGWAPGLLLGCLHHILCSSEWLHVYPIARRGKFVRDRPAAIKPLCKAIRLILSTELWISLAVPDYFTESHWKLCYRITYIYFANFVSNAKMYSHSCKWRFGCLKGDTKGLATVSWLWFSFF